MDQEVRDVIRRQTTRLRVMTEPGGWSNSIERLTTSIRKTTRLLKMFRAQMDRSYKV
jgi:hypothetical protein